MASVGRERAVPGIGGGGGGIRRPASRASRSRRSTMERIAPIGGRLWVIFLAMSVILKKVETKGTSTSHSYRMLKVEKGRPVNIKSIEFKTI